MASFNGAAVLAGRGGWPPQLLFALRRLRRFVLSVAALVVLSFAMLQLVPGDPVRAALGAGADESLVVETRAQLGLDEPVTTQLVDYVRNVLGGDFGTSIATRQPVSDVLAQRMPPTLGLTIAAFVVTLTLAMPIGLLLGIVCRNGRRPILGL